MHVVSVRRTTLAALLLVLPLAIAAPAFAADEAAPAAAPAIESNAAVLAHLERSRGLFLAAIAGLTPEQMAWKPAPERWSVAECAEHITRIEPFLRGFIQQAMAAPTDPAVLAKSHGKSAQVLAVVVDRSQKFQAPEPANPAVDGKVRSLAELERDFNFERGRTYQLVAGHADLESHALMNPAVQELDLAGWFYFVSGHVERHTLQIEEVKATAGFPRG